jgi:predicted nucleotidyltransferase
LATPELRDRDAIITEEGLIFRVIGCSHPSQAYFCDVEYAPATVFKSDEPKAFRNRGQDVFYKFYDDEAWKFIQDDFPEYMILHELLQRKVIGVKRTAIREVRLPERVLTELVHAKPKDTLIAAMQSVLDTATDHWGLPLGAFGVFGSLLHSFYHPSFSDIDLVIYGKENLTELRQALMESYGSESSPFRNEFETEDYMKGKVWRFRNFTPKEFLWHQKRKLVYSLFDSGENGRTIKTEFEPVKSWPEIRNEYVPGTKILQRGWVKLFARVTEDCDAPFIPSVYAVEPLRILEGGRRAQLAGQIVSYIEEFRMQALRDEVIYVEGNLEEVARDGQSFFQVVLTHCPRYYDQVLKTKTA